jgi:hypothetical protein
MKYEEETLISDQGESITRIIATDENGKEFGIPSDPANSDYQAYLRWLENPEAEHLNGSDN